MAERELLRGADQAAHNGFDRELAAAVARRGRPDPESSVGIAVIGAGPAGLTAAYVLAQRGEPAMVFEADELVGGIARTVEHNGYRFDLGGHRFFTKVKPVERLWEEIMGDEFLTRPRLSRIYYRGKFLSYPLTAKDVVARLGLIESSLCAFSYLWALRNRGKKADTFEDWVTVRFGKRLYNAFFRSYTEKVWGIPGSEIRSQWAAQRIKNFSLVKAVATILGIRREHVTTLIEEFRYPRLGPGQMWERFRDRVEEQGVEVQMRHWCKTVRHDDGRVTSIVVKNDSEEIEYEVDAVLSTMPLKDLVLSLEPPAPEHVRAAAEKLRYRDLCLVAVVTEQSEPFPDNWIYLHDPGTRAGRVQNFGAWSEDMVQPGTTCLGAEYFCFRGDEIWEMGDDEAVALTAEELGRIGLLDPSKVIDGSKVNVSRAYPMYDANYEDAVETIREYLSGFENLQTCGRNGLHRYNNQDHSMWTALLATLNLVGEGEHDVWSVNTEEAYHEQGDAEVSLDFETVAMAEVG
jgi:protoporphyrinogen oxidase